MQKYWVCWNKRGGKFAKEHETKQEAQAEATRLVNKTGDPIDVLECIGQWKPAAVPCIFEDAYDPMALGAKYYPKENYDPAKGL